MAKALVPGRMEEAEMRRPLPEQVLCLEPERSPFDGQFVVNAYDEVLIRVHMAEGAWEDLRFLFAE